MRQIIAFNNAKVGMTYGKLRVADINSTTGMVILDNKDNQITLSKNKTIELMPGIGIRTANQDTITADMPLRYYIYKEITKPGTYELRGAVANTDQDTFTWDNSTFPGFYYDIDKNLGTEKITFTLINKTPTSATLSDLIDANGNRGIVYATEAQTKNFKFKPWGQYDVIGFLGEKYFAAYDSRVTYGMTDAGETVPAIFDASRNKNLMINEQISKVLIDDDTVKLVKKGESIKLKDGYELVIKGINNDKQMYLQLLRNGQVVDESFIAPLLGSHTYCYRRTLGDTRDIVVIAVYFRSTYKDEEREVAVVNGIWQISDTPTLINYGQQYGKMSIRNVEAMNMTITMDNKGNPINLTRKTDVEFMPSIHLKTADNETLRYYICKTETIA